MSDTQRQLRGIRGKRNTRKKRKRSGGRSGDGPPPNTPNTDPIPTAYPAQDILPVAVPVSSPGIRAVNVAPLTPEQEAEIQHYESHVNNAISPYITNPTQILSDAKKRYVGYFNRLSEKEQNIIAFSMQKISDEDVKHKIFAILRKILDEIKDKNKTDTRELLVDLFRMLFIHPVRFLYEFILQLLKQTIQPDKITPKTIPIPDESVFVIIIGILQNVLEKYKGVVEIIIRAAENTKTFGIGYVLTSLQPFLLLLVERSAYGFANNVIDCNMLYYPEVLKTIDVVLKDPIITETRRKILLHYLLSFKTYIKTIQVNPEYKHEYEKYYPDKKPEDSSSPVNDSKMNETLDDILFECMTIINEAIEKKNDDDSTICVKTDVFLGRTFLDKTITNIYDSVNVFSTASELNYPYLVKLSSVVDYFIRRLWRSIITRGIALQTKINEYKMKTGPDASYITFGTRNLILFADKPRQFFTYYVNDIQNLLGAIKESGKQDTGTEDPDHGLLAMKAASAEVELFTELFEKASPDDFVQRYFTDIVKMFGGYCKQREDIIKRPETMASYNQSIRNNISVLYPLKKPSKKPTSKYTKEKNTPKKKRGGKHRITRKILIRRS